MQWLIRKHPVNLILYIYHHQLTENFAYKISKEINSTYCHMVVLVKRLVEAGLIEKINGETKRTKLLKLTDKGKKFAENLNKLKILLENGS